MPQLKTRKIFINHALKYDSHYYDLTNWLNEAPNFQWHNYIQDNATVMASWNQNSIVDAIRRWS